MSLKFIIVEDDPDKALLYEGYGIERIMIDLEVEGKSERQKGLQTWISPHQIGSISKLRAVLTKSELVVRINPPSERSAKEIESVLAGKPDWIMIPMFRTRQEIEQIVSCIAGRAQLLLLLETPQALSRVEDILSASGIDEIHIGLNDLTLGLGLAFLFEPLSGGLVEYLGGHFRQKKIPWGFGGIGTSQSGQVSGELIIKEHARLGSSRVIVSRTFVNSTTPDRFQIELDELRKLYQLASRRSEETSKIDQQEFVEKVNAIVRGRT